MHEAGAPWTGALRLYPGLAAPGNLATSRPDLVAQLTQGRLARELPELLANVHNLCGSAHRLCAGLAVQAAHGAARAMDSDQAERLRSDTLREHLRRIGLEWPRHLADTAEPSEAAGALQALRSGPVSTAAPPASWAAQREGIAAWLARDWLDMPAEAWLQAWELGPRDWLGLWAAHARGWLPRLLHRARATADQPIPWAPALRVHAHPGGLQELAGALQHAAFARAPLWQGRCADTGPWTRLHQRDAERFTTPWLRLGARLAEAVRLALPDGPARSGARWLQAGQLALTGHTGLAWVETARGLLVHCVTLNGAGPQARVQRCSVVAPTDWNFHARGALAQALAQLPRRTATADTRRILALMAAYDPCVPFVIDAEPGHA
ncbi:hydrogenase formation protein [Pseudorhodoferax sp. Leaf267]|uniref:hydrogenase formation protein n=1 Tax=Pseudorhodoferax sp. Leaf267 TaxID=1736316 RepID=UPI000A8DCD52|nr:hydrogenase formation protein [Pseudorhodoferax sp. Leaf267]